MQGFCPADGYPGGEPYLIDHLLRYPVLRVAREDDGRSRARADEFDAFG
jgi:hypothetical protein